MLQSARGRSGDWMGRGVGRAEWGTSRSVG